MFTREHVLSRRRFNIIDWHRKCYILIEEIGFARNRIISNNVMNIPENYSPRAKRVVEFAKRAMLEFGASNITVEHLLLALLRLEEGVAYNALVHLGVQVGDLEMQLVEQIKRGNAQEPATRESEFSMFAAGTLRIAASEANALRHAYVGTEHLILGILSSQNQSVSNLLKKFGLTYEIVKTQIEKELNIPASPKNVPAKKETKRGENKGAMDEIEAAMSEAAKRLEALLGNARKDQEEGSEPAEEIDEDEPPFDAPRGGREPRERRRSALKAFCHDLTEEARAGKFDPLVGRENEVRQVIEVLCRRRKSNPVLLGEAGVGKTAVVEGLAQAIVEKRVPEILQNKRVVSLAINDMLAGTQFRGQFEERIKGLIEEIVASKNVILFIDEIHTIVGAGKSEGAPGDAANILKPALSRGGFQCIGATTLSEYRKFIEKDAALERRFQSINIDAPSEDEAINILKGIARNYEVFHNCHYLPEAIEAAVHYSERYIPARNLPDKAIDIIDQAGARARLTTFDKPQKLIDVEEKAEAFEDLRKKAVEDEDLEAARDYKNKRDDARAEQEKLHKAWQEQRSRNVIDISVEQVLEVISNLTKIPVSRMNQGEAKRLLGLEAELRRSVIAQDDACSAIARALRRSRANLKDPKRPIGSFLFLGPTGVGKTLLAKTITEQMFGTSDALIQIDMSEYMEKINVSRLIGAAPGYVGYEEGGKLTEAVRHKPYSVVLFDEIEKAHPDAIQLLLQVLEEGGLTDSLGRKVDFRNTIIIMTSNVGADALQRNSRMGFGSIGTAADYEGAKSLISDEVKRVFKPEFLNRLTDCIFFHQLSKADIGEIVKIEVEKLSKRLESQGASLKLSKAAYDFLVDVGYDEKFGARPLRRAVERHLEDPLSEEILRNADKKFDGPIAVDAGENELKFYCVYKSEKKSAPKKRVPAKAKKRSRV